MQDSNSFMLFVPTLILPFIIWTTFLVRLCPLSSSFNESRVKAAYFRCWSQCCYLRAEAGRCIASTSPFRRISPAKSPRFHLWSDADNTARYRRTLTTTRERRVRNCLQVFEAARVPEFLSNVPVVPNIKSEKSLLRKLLVLALRFSLVELQSYRWLSKRFVRLLPSRHVFN